MSIEVDVDTTLAALADPARREAVDLLRKSPMRASDLADALSMSRPAMSRHLRVLRNAGLIEQEISQDDGRVRMVQLCREPFSSLRDWVNEVEVFWTDQLDAFKTHAENKRKRRRR